MAKAFDIFINGSILSISNSFGNNWEIEQGLPRLLCPSCEEPNCHCDCDGSQGADENNNETEEETANRLKYNNFLDNLELIVLSHAQAGVNVENPKYGEGLALALNKVF